MTTSRWPARARAATTSFVLAAAAIAQVPAPTPPAPPPPAKAEAWPPLKDTEKDKLLALVGQFRKDNPKLHDEAKQQLITLGPGAAPLLMQQVSDRDDDANEHVLAVLDAILTEQHAVLMARETKKPRVALRRYLTRRLCRFGDASLVPVFESLQQDKDEQTAFFAKLALFVAGRKDALPDVLAYTKAHWSDVAPLLAEVLPPVRSAAMGTIVFERIAKAPVPDQMTGLRLLRHLMVVEQGVVLRTYLEAADHTVKREAVNTARVVHGEPPIDNLSVFQAIEMAKAWGKKL